MAIPFPARTARVAFVRGVGDSPSRRSSAAHRRFPNGAAEPRPDLQKLLGRSQVSPRADQLRRRLVLNRWLWMSLAELAQLDAIGQAELRATGQVSALELWEACQQRIAALDPLLGAVVALSEAPTEPQSGPLAGVPFLVKDSAPWPGLPWTLGARLFAGRVTRQHTEYGERLAAAGLVCAGKTALSEFGLLASTESRLFGPTHNPWSLACSALGSSGGSAAAVAAGLVPLAHANDGGGSIRAPASACGLFGFKPSRGRTVLVNRSGSDFSDMTSEHCITRSVRDSALFLSLTEDTTRGDALGFVKEPLRRRLRVGAWSSSLFDEEPDAAVLRAHQDTLELLAALGHVVEPIAGPRLDAPRFGDALYVVAAAAVANVIQTVDRTRREPVQRRELEPFTWALVDLLESRGPRAVQDARVAIAEGVAAYREATRGFDVVVTPVLGREPPEIGYLSPVLPYALLRERSARVLAYTPIHNVVGCPAMSVPLHWSERGLPIGAHIAAEQGQDGVLLELAYELERARPWRDRWPLYSIPRLGLDD